MTVAVTPVHNDVRGRNQDLLTTALGVATNLYKVGVDEKQQQLIRDLALKKDEEKASAEDQKLSLELAEKMEIVDKGTKGSIDPKDVGLRLPRGFNLPDGKAFRPRSITEQENKLLSDKENRAAERDARFAIAAMGQENKKPTEGERATALYGKRLQSSDQVLTQMENDPNINVTGIGAFAQGFLPEGLQGKELQQLANAKRNFVTAVLRKESGAAISDSEFATADKLYFAQPGDSPEVVAQKQALRQQVIGEFQQMAGKGWSDGAGNIAQKDKAPEKIKTSVGEVSKQDILNELKRRQQGTASK